MSTKKIKKALIIFSFFFISLFGLNPEKAFAACNTLKESNPDPSILYCDYNSNDTNDSNETIFEDCMGTPNEEGDECCGTLTECNYQTPTPEPTTAPANQCGSNSIYNPLIGYSYCDVNNDGDRQSNERPYLACTGQNITGWPCCTGTGQAAIDACASLAPPTLCGSTLWSSPEDTYYCNVNGNYTLDVFSGSLSEGSYTDCVGSPTLHGGRQCCIGPEQQARCATLIISVTPRPTLSVTPNPTHAPTVAPTTNPSPNPFSPYNAPSNSFFDALNPLKHAGGQNIFEDTPSEYADVLSTPGGILTRLLAFAFPLAGLILFVMLVWGGFEILIQAPSKKAIDAGKQRVTAAIIGFILLFISYWIWQIIEVMFGVAIL